MVNTNFPRSPEDLATPTGRNPQNRQMEPFSNTSGREGYLGMNQGRLTQPDQTPALSALEDEFDSRHEYDEDEENLDENGESIDETEKISESAGPSESRQGETALRQAKFKAQQAGEAEEASFFHNLLQREWMSVQKRLKIVDAVERAKKIFHDGSGEKISTKELVDSLEKRPQRPSFPTEIFTMSLVKDIIDMPAEAGAVATFGISTIIGEIFSTFVAIVLLFWTFNKVNGWFGAKKAVLRKIYTLLAATIVAEYIPIIKIIPLSTTFVLLAHYRETKVVKLINLALDVIHEKGGINTIDDLIKANTEMKKAKQEREENTPSQGQVSGN